MKKSGAFGFAALGAAVFAAASFVPSPFAGPASAASQRASAHTRRGTAPTNRQLKVGNSLAPAAVSGSADRSAGYNSASVKHFKYSSMPMYETMSYPLRDIMTDTVVNAYYTGGSAVINEKVCFGCGLTLNGYSGVSEHNTLGATNMSDTCVEIKAGYNYTFVPTPKAKLPVSCTTALANVIHVRQLRDAAGGNPVTVESMPVTLSTYNTNVTNPGLEADLNAQYADYEEQYKEFWRIVDDMHKYCACSERGKGCRADLHDQVFPGWGLAQIGNVMATAAGAVGTTVGVINVIKTNETLNLETARDALLAKNKANQEKIDALDGQINITDCNKWTTCDATRKAFWKNYGSCLSDVCPGKKFNTDQGDNHRYCPVMPSGDVLATIQQECRGGISASLTDSDETSGSIAIAGKSVTVKIPLKTGSGSGEANEQIVVSGTLELQGSSAPDNIDGTVTASATSYSIEGFGFSAGGSGGGSGCEGRPQKNVKKYISDFKGDTLNGIKQRFSFASHRAIFQSMEDVIRDCIPANVPASMKDPAVENKRCSWGAGYDCWNLGETIYFADDIKDNGPVDANARNRATGKLDTITCQDACEETGGGSGATTYSGINGSLVGQAVVEAGTIKSGTINVTGYDNITQIVIAGGNVTSYTMKGDKIDLDGPTKPRGTITSHGTITAKNLTVSSGDKEYNIDSAKVENLNLTEISPTIKIRNITIKGGGAGGATRSVTFRFNASDNDVKCNKTSLAISRIAGINDPDSNFTGNATISSLSVGTGVDLSKYFSRTSGISGLIKFDSGIHTGGKFINDIPIGDISGTDCSIPAPRADAPGAATFTGTVDKDALALTSSNKTFSATGNITFDPESDANQILDSGNYDFGSVVINMYDVTGVAGEITAPSIPIAARGSPTVIFRITSNLTFSSTPVTSAVPAVVPKGLSDKIANMTEERTALDSTGWQKGLVGVDKRIQRNRGASTAMDWVQIVMGGTAMAGGIMNIVGNAHNIQKIDDDKWVDNTQKCKEKVNMLKMWYSAYKVDSEI